MAPAIVAPAADAAVTDTAVVATTAASAAFVAAVAATVVVAAFMMPGMPLVLRWHETRRLGLLLQVRLLLLSPTRKSLQMQLPLS